MIWLLFVPRIDIPSTNMYWEELFSNINLIPFLTIYNLFKSILTDTNNDAIIHSVVNLSGNVVMFIPLGFFITNSIAKKTFKKSVLLSLICIIFVELIQLFTLLGCCDVDDLILNMLGVIIGYKLFITLYKTKSKSKNT